MNTLYVSKVLFETFVGKVNRRNFHPHQSIYFSSIYLFHIYIYIYRSWFEDCISKKVTVAKIKLAVYPGYNIELHLMLRFGGCGVPLYCHYSQVHSRVVVLVRIQCVVQINLLLGIIIVSYWKPPSSVQIVCIR